MHKAYPELNGAWEERGVIGSRIEIDGGNITVLWRNTPVLETKFKPEPAEDGIELVLRKNGLRYANAGADYAAVKRIVFADGKLIFTECFPISGESRTVMTKTDNSRYGDYSIENHMLQELQGRWTSEGTPWALVIKKDTLELGGRKTKIVVLRSKSPCEPQGRYVIADQDPSVYEWEGFSRFDYENGKLSARLLVCDAPSVEYVFRKVR